MVKIYLKGKKLYLEKNNRSKQIRDASIHYWSGDDEYKITVTYPNSHTEKFIQKTDPLIKKGIVFKNVNHKFPGAARIYKYSGDGTNYNIHFYKDAIM